MAVVITLADLLKDSVEIEITGDHNKQLKGVALDSRKVKSDYLFVAKQGSASDGHDFIDSAIQNGATVICCQKMPKEINDEVTYVRCDEVEKLLGGLASNFYEDPSRNLKLIGVTGTNGKTTVATLTYSLFKELGYQVGLISTIEILINDRKIESTLTTPDVIELNRLLNEMVDAQCEYVFMEVSSHAVDQGRIEGLNFAGAVFTNLSRDHLDYHKTFKAYIAAKKKLFDDLKPSSFALVNVDDRNGELMVQNTSAFIKKYSLRNLVNYKTKVLSAGNEGLHLDINDGQLFSSLSGRFNAYNLTAVYGIADLLDVGSDDEVRQGLSRLKAVSGRFDVVSRMPMIIIDYAHTPDALINVLKSIVGLKPQGKVITVVGCGGDRDKGKRSEMAAIAAKISDKVVFTADNPRFENVDDIIQDMMIGIKEGQKKKVMKIADRATAIKVAIDLSNEADVILIAGKGHETYQEIKGVRMPFSDHKIVKDILSEDI